ncbi:MULTISPECIES: hypothetical protein [unclassified Polaribacter]|uniref:hypothetical protein n=1 Tax=unclassified Polaribacter TaxID=196858 RepID=UPI0011BE3753|nr:MULTISPECIES: hypothetical protein [unclassified Polaribacter]TXD46010.1 hypothetical protein ES043_18505 [Polaribacter sp. IC063]TXD54832.1 hypothetical protein ES044_18315 [Polaribacter sp. IC066]
MKTVRNIVTVTNLNKFNKMSLEDFESKKEKHIIELNENNYYYLLAIKSGNLKIYKDKKDLEKIKKLAEYFFGTIPLRKQNTLLKASETTLLKSPLVEFQSVEFPLEYIRYLNARNYVYNHLNLT